MSNRRPGRPRNTKRDPIVKIDGPKIYAAFPLVIMKPKRLSINAAAKMLRERGVQITAPSLNQIILGRTKKTRKSVLDELMRITEITYVDGDR